jgi:hypothetical protein
MNEHPDARIPLRSGPSMSTLANAVARDALVARLERLSPEAPAAWGRMTAPLMLAHCSDALRMGLGDLPVKSRGKTIAQTALVKWLFFNVLPFPKDAPTANELISRTPAPWDVERADLIALIHRSGSADASVKRPPHPLFGPLTTTQWGQLTWKHLDHHLRQFGV